MANSTHSLILNKDHHIELSTKDRNRNIFIAGLPSTGVSTYVSELILQDIENAQKTIILDPYGYMSDLLLTEMNSSVKEKTAYLDLGNLEFPIGLNLFEAENDEQRRDAANLVIELIYALYDPNRTGIIGPRFEHAVRNAVLTVLYDDKSSFIELVRCLTDASYVNKLLPKITDPIIKNYWTKQIANTADFHKSEILDYIVSKFSRFITDPKIRNIVGQTESCLNFEKLLSEKDVIIFDFSKFKNDREALKILSEIILTKFTHALAKNRNTVVSLYIDEVEFFSGTKLTELLRFNKNYNLNLLFVTQRLADLDMKLRNELIRSGTIISFRLNTADAQMLAAEYYKNISVSHLCLLQKYHMVLKTLKNGNPVIYEEINNEKVNYKPKQINDNELEKLKSEKSKHYGNPRLYVEKEINNRMS